MDKTCQSSWIGNVKVNRRDKFMDKACQCPQTRHVKVRTQDIKVHRQDMLMSKDKKDKKDTEKLG